MNDLIFLILLHSLQEIGHSRIQVWVYQVTWLMIEWFDLPNLTTFITGTWSFSKATCLFLESEVIDYWLIRSSSTHKDSGWIQLILWSTYLQFVKFDDSELIDLIFLSSLSSLEKRTHSLKQKGYHCRV